jgi:uncharacterized protein (TIGR00730 family)
MNLSNKGIAVFCASSSAVAPHYLDAAAAVGHEIGSRSGVIVYGGATVGLMGQVADAAMAAGGRVYGVMPQLLVDREVAHTGIHELVVVETMHERKALMSERAAAYVILPGGFGTYDEFFEVLTWKQLGMHRKPIILVNLAGYYDPLLAQIDHAIAEGMIKPAYRELFTAVTDVPGLIHVLETAPEPDLKQERWF